MGKSIEDFRTLSDEKWLKLLIKSVDTPEVLGLRFPEFPPDATQAQFVGSSREQALREAYAFYTLAKNSIKELGHSLNSNSVALDFGCGWGRFIRFLWKDFAEENIYGCDIDPDILALDKELGIPGNLLHIEPNGRLQMEDNSVDFIIAYSVFTHLPEGVFQHWLAEIKRVARPGCIFALTIEPRRFLDFIGGLKGQEHVSGWHAALGRHAENTPQLLEDYDNGKFVYLPTGGGAHRGSDIYGDAVVPIDYVKKSFEPEFRIVHHIDNPSRFWQAAVVAEMS